MFSAKGLPFPLPPLHMPAPKSVAQVALPLLTSSRCSWKSVFQSEYGLATLEELAQSTECILRLCGADVEGDRSLCEYQDRSLHIDVIGLVPGACAKAAHALIDLISKWHAELIFDNLPSWIISSYSPQPTVTERFWFPSDPLLSQKLGDLLAFHDQVHLRNIYTQCGAKVEARVTGNNEYYAIVNAPTNTELEQAIASLQNLVRNHLISDKPVDTPPISFSMGSTPPASLKRDHSSSPQISPKKPRLLSLPKIKDLFTTPELSGADADTSSSSIDTSMSFSREIIIPKKQVVVYNEPVVGLGISTMPAPFNEKILARISELESTTSRLRNDIVDIHHRNVEMVTAIEDLECENHGLKDSVQILEDQHSNMKLSLRMLEAQNSHLRQQVQELRGAGQETERSPNRKRGRSISLNENDDGCRSHRRADSYRPSYFEGHHRR